ncbi:alpha/beta hydrolase family protein [Cellulomonas composti]|uniref:Peptidase S9 n=1 Tax=Cellulomonas composti TaxID=266130 RepID=A0A511JDV4_9CELL|nr:acyl-CoA thioester hydrolase/BAAT C-terminal domain-containing protein [Cellulomonas composti]GEL96180.1 peptidase S9 [Cellulomonas composti]
MLRRRSATPDGVLTGPYRVAAGAVLGVVLLAILGAVTGPQWDPVPLTDPLTVETTDTAIGGAPALQEYPVRTSVVTVQLDGTTVQAQVSEPVGAPWPRRGVVFLHGAGTGTYEEGFYEQAARLAQAGVVTIVPNKRMDTYDLRHRDYVAMAADYARSVDVLRDWPGVDPDDIGLYAESEGAWIAPVMAAADQDLSFVVLVSAPVVPPREQAAFAADNYLRNTRVPHGVFRAIPRAVGMSLPGGGVAYADFDVTPYQRQMTQPVLMVYGTGDASMPIVQAAELVIRDTAIAGNDDVTVRYYEGATHGIKVAGEIVPAFLHDMTSWVVGLPATAGAAPRIAGDQPQQAFLAAPVPEPRWMRDGDLVAGTVAVACALVALAGVLMVGARGVELVRVRPGSRAPRNRFARGVPESLAVVGIGAVGVIVGLVWYIIAIARLALDYAHNDWVVKGGWIAVRLVGIVAVVAVVVLLRASRRAGAEGVPIAPGIVRKVAYGLVVVAASVLLVVAAYWGVYQLGI